MLSERSILTVTIAALAMLWAFDQLTIIAFFALAGISGALLLQLEIKRRLEDLKNRRIAAQKKRLDRRNSAKTLRASALNSLPSPILLVDENHQISFANEAAQSLLGHTVVSDDVFLYLRQPNFVDALEATLSGEVVTDTEIRYTSSEERSFDISITSIVRGHVHGKKSAQAMIFFYEVTSLLRAEQMRVDFVANASHELRTPLTTITGFVETLLGSAADDPASHEKFLKIMQREAERMNRLIDDLLSLSRIEMTRHIEPNKIVHIAGLVNEALTACTHVAQERNITFSTNYCAKGSQVVGDGEQMTQVFTNLLGNAAKYADRNTVVHITTSLDPNDEERITLAIADEGPGIAPEHLARLTERFYRVDTARSRKVGGTGLGLAIVKHILLRHRTHLKIESHVGAGTKFAFQLRIGTPDEESNTNLYDNENCEYQPTVTKL